MALFYCPICKITKRVKAHKGRKFCSRKCLSEAALQERFLPKICVVCGKGFQALRIELNRGKAKCCSLKCGAQMAVRGRKPAPRKICKACGKEFKARSEQVKAGKANYCSNKCFGVKLSKVSGSKHYLWKPRVKKNCRLCGEEFEVEQNLFNKQTLCSQQCAAINAHKHCPNSNTSIERKIEAFLKERGIPFEAQKRIKGVSIPDFVVGNLCIFADGDYWHNYPIGTEKDHLQNERLKKMGYEVLRFWERTINSNFEFVAQEILNANQTPEN